MSNKPQALEEAFADLHVFAAIEVICENSILRTSTGRRLARKIAKLCQEQQGVQLRRYDRLREIQNDG